jgi:hypothetical protein
MKTSKNVINSTSFSMFSVVNTSYSGTTDSVICGAWKLQYGSFGLFSAKTPTIRGNISTGTTYAAVISDSTPLINLPKTILGLVVSGDTASSFGTTSFNGIPTTTSVTGSNYAGQDEFFGVGCIFEGGLHYYPLQSTTISEIIVFKTALTTSQRQQIEGYLAHKWGLNTALTGGLTKPTQIPGCALWLDGADPSSMTFSSGSNVSAWADKSGKGRNATQGTVGNQPTYVSNVIQCRSAGSQFMSITQALGTALVGTTWDIFVVGQRISTGYNSFFSGTEATGNQNLLIGFDTLGTSLTINPYGTGVGGTVSQWTSGEPYSVFGFEYNGTTQSVFRTGSLVGSSNVALTLTAFLGPQIGRRYGGASGAVYQDFNYSEIVIFTPSITTAQRQSVEGYLATKWGLRASLPATHPSYTGIAAQPFALMRPFTRRFQPVDIPGCALWLDAGDASTITLSGSNVTGWLDKSGQGTNYVQATTANQPSYAYDSTYRNNGIFFGGINNTTSHILTPSNTAITPISNSTGSFTIFTVHRFGVYNAGFGDLYRGQSGSGLFFRASSASNTTPVYANNYITITTPVNGVTAYSGDTTTGLSFFLNGISAGTTTKTAGAGSVGNIVLGANLAAVSPSSESFNGFLFEFLVFNAALTTSQRQQIEGYLSWKWGLNAQLPGVPSNPLWEPGLALWLDAGDATTFTFSSGSNVSVWNDKSGNNRHVTQATSANQPLYNSGSRRIECTLSNMTLQNTANMSLNHTATLIVVSGTFDTVTNSRMVEIQQSGTAPNGTQIIVENRASSSVRMFFLGPNSTRYGDFTRSGLTSIATVQRNGTANLPQGCVDGGVLTTLGLIDANYTVPDAVIIGRNAVGYVQEVIIFNTALTTSQRQGVETYLARKWGLTVPTSTPHPYFALPATTTTSFSPLILYSQVLPFQWNTSWSPYLNTLTAANSGAMVTASRSAMGASISLWWAGGVLAPNGKIYSVPVSATTILIIDTLTETATTSTMSADLAGSTKWTGGVLAPNGKIYCVPRDSVNILIIDPVAGTATRSAMGASLTGSSKWTGGVLAPNGKIYCVPNNATTVLIIDPVAGTASTSTMGADLTGTNKWAGGVLAPNGKIYCIPYGATDILIIDPVAGTATRSTMGASLTGSAKWDSGVLAPNGKIYGNPSSSADILIIDTVAGTATRSTMGATITADGDKWIGGVLAPNGKIYCVPCNITDILIIDPVAGTATRSSLGATIPGGYAWTGGVLAPNGTIYCTPLGATDILRIQTNVAVDSNFAMSPYFNKF